MRQERYWRPSVEYYVDLHPWYLLALLGPFVVSYENTLQKYANCRIRRVLFWYWILMRHVMGHVESVQEST